MAGYDTGQAVMIRAFVAIELDDALKQAIGQAQQRVKDRLMKRLGVDARIQWVRPEAMHLTMKFLGDIQETSVEDMRLGVAAATGSVPAFSVDVGVFGVFPDLRAPRVLWVGLQDRSGVLIRLADAVETAFAGLGIPRERRPFQPHLTLARIKDHGREVGQALAAGGALDEPVEAGRLAVSAISLMHSRLQPTGAVYTRLWAVPLQSAE